MAQQTQAAAVAAEINQTLLQAALVDLVLLLFVT
jgi:hypothetical protein